MAQFVFVNPMTQSSSNSPYPTYPTDPSNPAQPADGSVLNPETLPIGAQGQAALPQGSAGGIGPAVASDVGQFASSPYMPWVTAGALGLLIGYLWGKG